MTMDKVYQHRPSGLTGATATTTTGITSTRPIHSIGLSLNGSVNSLVNSPSSLSRLPQRRESKIPGPNSQGSPGCVLNGISSTSCQPTLSSNCSSTPAIAPPKKFLNPPSKLLSSNQVTSSTANGTESSLRSVSPATVFKCKSTTSHLIVPSSQMPPTSSSSMTTMISPASSCVTSSVQNSTTTSATCNGNNSETSRGIRPPRSASSMSSNVLPSNGSMSTGKSTLTVSRSHITKHSVINNGLATVGRSGSIQGHHRSVTLRESKDDREAPRRSKTPSSSSSPSTSGTLRSNNNGRLTAGNLTNGLNCNRSDSTPSLSETDSGSEKKKITGNNKSLIRSNFGKGLGGGVGGGSSQSIPLPKSRPNSVCLDNSTITSSQSSTPVITSSTTVSSVNGTNTVSKGTKSSLRPLSSSGIPKTGLSSCYRGERPNPSTSEDHRTDTVQRRRRVVTNVESHLAPTRSEPNVARVSPIRRSIGQIGNGDSVTSRPGSGLKEDNHQQSKQQHHQYSPGDKMDQDNYSSTGLAGRNVASKSSSSSNVTSNAMVPSSISSPTPLSSASTTSSSSSIIATSSTPSTTVTTTVTTTSTSFHPTLMHQLPLGLSSVNRASEPMLPIRSISTAASSNTVSTLKSVMEESLPVKARSILSLSSPSSPTNPSVDNKDAYPQIKTIDLSGNILSFLDSSTRTISSSCDLISTSTRCDSNNRSSGSLSLSSGNFNSNITESSHSYSNGFMSPVLEDERSSPSRESIESPFESPFNQTVIDKSKPSLTNIPSSPTINASLNTDQQVNKVNENGTTFSMINSSFNNNSTTTVSSSANLINKVNRRNKCILPSEAELSLKTDLRLQNNGLTSCGSIMELNSNGSNIISTTPPPLSTLQLAPPPPPLILQSSLTNQVKRLSKNGEFRGSTISLLSGSSSFSATEERHNQEMKKLREELNRANNKVETLNQQLKNSNDMIQTFGKSLETLRSRLHQCSLATDQKDREIARLKTTIEVLRRECANGESTGANQSCYGSNSDIETRRDKNKKRSHKEPRSPSRDRDGINSGDSGPSGWFKGSIQRAFKKNRSRNKSGGSMSDVEGTIRLNNGGDSSSLPSTPLTLNNCSNGKTDPFIGLNLATANGTTVNGSLDSMVKEESELIEDLKKQLREKEKQLNDIRLEVLLTASQTESLNDRMCKMNKEMSLLRSENHRLQCLLRRQSITSSIGSLTSCFEGTLSCNVNGNPNGAPASCSSSSSNGSSAAIGFGIERKIPIRLGMKRIGLLTVNNQITWDILDEIIRRAFDSYLRKIDAERLEMRSISLISYSFGSERFERKLSLDKGSSSPLTSLPSPIDFLSRNNYISLYLRSKLDYLIMDTCTPKSVLEKITSHLKESRRLIICGPPNCGKSFIAMKCCQFLLEEYCMDCATGIASISVRENSDKEIECFISNVLNCDEIARPKAIVFKGIHNLANFASLMKPIHGIHSNDLPLLLCTMRGVNNCTTNLQIYHNFRSVIYNQSSEPCKNLLSRVLRKKAVDAEIDALIHGSSYNFNSLSVIIDWFQQLFHHLNLFLEAFSSPLTPHNLGPSVFFSCPLDIEASQEWFIDTWNHTIVPNVKQIVENYSSEAVETSSPMQDPLIWVKDNYPWIENKEHLHKLSPIIVKNDGSGCKPKVDSITDQLHNTLLRLQEVTKG
ncbi:neuron navigator 2 [Tetranychus urticae]|uniref:neuron navigator 2 n=1 Tax=Tetranychus urticae TaxID=32264 RepID=UPI000D65C872|nr:neuron navigator 2 [Tetranychus urticae]